MGDEAYLIAPTTATLLPTTTTTSRTHSKNRIVSIVSTGLLLLLVLVGTVISWNASVEIDSTYNALAAVTQRWLGDDNHEKSYYDNWNPHKEEEYNRACDEFWIENNYTLPPRMNNGFGGGGGGGENRQRYV